MIRLRLLGPLGLDGLDPERASALVGGEKRVALLAYLLLAGQGDFVRRDTLLALLWPEVDESHGRGALRALIHQLRGALGPSVLPSRADQALRVEPGALRCDVHEFEAACAAGEWGPAILLYRGPLLEGFGVSGAPAFEEWLAGERDRLQRLALDLAWRTADRATAAGDRSGEVDALRRLLEWAPYEERAARRLMAVLDGGGDRAGALHAFERFAARLEADLEVPPAPETAELASALRARTAPNDDTPMTRAVPASPSSAEASSGALPIRVGRARLAAAGATLALVALAGALGPHVSARFRRTGSGHVVVRPFRTVTGDTTLVALARSLPALLGRRLEPDAGPPAAADEAPGVHALILEGLVAEAPPGIALSADLIDATTGGRRARATVEGPTDSLASLLDRLTALLLVRDAGEPELRVPHLARVSLPALRWYLEGQRLLRTGQSDQARDALAEALDHDSTFAAAGLALSVAAGAGGGPMVGRGLEVAWRWREQLAPADRQFLAARLGPRHPAPSSLAEQLAAWEALLPPSGGQPLRREILYGYADLLFHYGALLGITDAHELAAAAFERADRLDPATPASLQHLADLAFIHRDTARLRPVVASLLRRLDGDTARWVAAWMLAAAVGDARARAQIPRGLDQAALFNLSLQAGVALRDAEHVAGLWRVQAVTLGETIGQLELQAMLALNQGRPEAARTFLDSAWDLAGSAPHVMPEAEALDRAAVLAVLYWDADTLLALRAVPRLRSRAGRPPPGDSVAWSGWMQDRCTLSEWELWTGGSDAEVPPAGPEEALCGAVLTALGAVVRRAPDARRLVDALDSLARTGPPGWIRRYPHGNLLVARLYQRQGRHAEALHAARRRLVYYLSANRYLSTYLREEGRLAIAVGDTAGAIRSFRHYLALREDPEPGLVPERDAIRRHLTTLTRPGSRLPGSLSPRPRR